MISRIATKLRSRTAAVAPPVPTLPDFIAVTARIAVFRWFRNSCASAPSREFEAGRLSSLDAGDRHSGFNGEIRDGLADIAVIPNHLFNRESLMK